MPFNTQVAESMLDSKPMRSYRKTIFKEAAREAASQGIILAAKKIFRSVDGDGNGKLDRDELGENLFHAWLLFIQLVRLILLLIS